MNKCDVKKLAEEAIPLLQKMFGEGLDFEVSEYHKSNETVTGIALKLPGCSNPPIICMENLPDDATAEEIANIVASGFQNAIRNFRGFPALPKITKENILENVVLQALSRKRNRQLLRVHPHILFLDLAGIFRIPVGQYEKNSLNTMLVTNQILDDLGLTVEELAEAAKRNTVAKFGVEFVNAPKMALCSLQKQPWTPEPFEVVRMTEPGLYTLTNRIHINGAALLLIPEILEAIGEKAGMDYFLLPSSIHELLVAKDDGKVTAKMLKELVYDGNRTEGMIHAEDVLSDNVYFYSRKAKELKIV